MSADEQEKLNQGVAQDCPRCLWILNGCGVVGDSITGGPVRFHAISRRWQRDFLADQHVLTTSGGATMLLCMGCELPMTLVPAALLLRHEPCRAFRLWSYIVSSVTAPAVMRRMTPPDVVITVSDYFCDVGPALRLKRRHAGLRWIACIYHKETPPDRRPGNRVVNTLTWKMQEWSFARIARHADQVWVSDNAAGECVQARLRELGMPEERLRRVANGVDPGMIKGVLQPAKTVDAVMVGVRPNKGMHDIIPIWTAVQRLRPGTTLRLMGGMNGAEPVLDAIGGSELSKTIDVRRPDGGMLSPEDYIAAIKEALILFAPSHEEGWGIAVCEAMACGLPVAAYDLPTYRAIYGDALGVVPCFEHEAFARMVVDLLNDAEKRRRHISKGYRCAESFDWDRIACEDAQALRATISKSPQRSITEKRNPT